MDLSPSDITATHFQVVFDPTKEMVHHGQTQHNSASL